MLESLFLHFLSNSSPLKFREFSQILKQQALILIFEFFLFPYSWSLFFISLMYLLKSSKSERRIENIGTQTRSPTSPKRCSEMISMRNVIKTGK